MLNSVKRLKAEYISPQENHQQEPFLTQLVMFTVVMNMNAPQFSLGRLYLSELIDMEVSYGHFTSRNKFLFFLIGGLKSIAWDLKLDLSFDQLQHITKQKLLRAMGNMKENQFHSFIRIYMVPIRYSNGRLENSIKCYVLSL